MPTEGIARMTRIYCESGAVTRGIRKLRGNKYVEVVHFPYDRASHIPRVARVATPSGARIRNLNLPIRELPGTLTDYSESVHFAKILSVVGQNNREDALHIDSAFKHNCSVFITRDRGDILAHKTELTRLLGIKFFHPDEWRWRLRCQFLCACGLVRAKFERP